MIGDHFRRSESVAKSVCEVRIAGFHQSGETVRDFNILCSIKIRLPENGSGKAGARGVTAGGITGARSGAATM